MSKVDTHITDKLLLKWMLIIYPLLIGLTGVLLFGIRYPAKLSYSNLKWKQSRLTIQVPESEMIKIKQNDSVHLTVGDGESPEKVSGVVDSVESTAKNGTYHIYVALKGSEFNTRFASNQSPLIFGERKSLFSILFVDN